MGVAFGDVEGYGDGFLAVYGRVGGCGLRGELSALDLLHDTVEVGVHVWVFGRVEFTFNGWKLFLANIEARFSRRLGSGCVC